MDNHLKLIEELYDRRYKGNEVWEKVVKKLTTRQAYVFYYSLIFNDVDTLDSSLGFFSLPDRTMVHKCLMDTLLKKHDHKYLVQMIGDSAHEIVINDNEMLWIKSNLRAALWLGQYMIDTKFQNKHTYSQFFISSSRDQYIHQLIHVIDIYGCSPRRNKIQTLKNHLSGKLMSFKQESKQWFNLSQNDYLLSRVSDYKLNWLNKLSEESIDIIIEKFSEDQILILNRLFIPITKKDKIETIKASLDLQEYKNCKSMVHRNSHYRDYHTSIYNDENTEPDGVLNKSIKKTLKERNVQEIIDLLKKAHNSRDYRKAQYIAKNDRSIALGKEPHLILIKLSEQFQATPKKTLEALIRNIDLKDEHEVLKINKLISGKRSVEKKLSVESTDVTYASVDHIETVGDIESGKINESEKVQQNSKLLDRLTVQKQHENAMKRRTKKS